MKMRSAGGRIVGRCCTMCPESEVQFRLANNMVHALEKPEEGTSDESADLRRRMVKEYSRPAAGSDHLRLDAIRPPKVLLATVRHLLDVYRSRRNARFNAVYSFVCDRLRAVRQDMILQEASSADAVQILEEMIPFYLETGYICRTTKCDVYDWKLHSTQLEECLSRWVDAALLVSADLVSRRVLCAYILHLIPSQTALLQLYGLRGLLEEELFHLLRDILISFRSGNYVRFFRSLSQLPDDCPTVAAVEAVQAIRLRALSTIRSAYKSSDAMLPRALLAAWLSYDDISELLSCFAVPSAELVPVSFINVHSVLSDDSIRVLAKMRISF